MVTKGRLVAAPKHCFLIVVVVLWVHTAIKTHQIVHFTWVQFIFHELYSKKVDKKL